VIATKVEGASADDLRVLADQLRKLAPSVAIALGSAVEERVTVIVALSSDLVKRGLHAGKIAGEAAKLVGGGGGGSRTWPRPAARTRPASTRPSRRRQG